MLDLGRLPKSAVALLAALGVLVVLITPAFDELPSTAPHSQHLPVTLAVSVVPSLLLHVVFSGLRHEPVSARLVTGSDLLSLNCSRLC